MLAEKGCRLVFGFLVGIYVARQLGPARYGLLNYAISFVALFSVLATLGMDPVVVRELVRRPGKANSILGSALGLKALGNELCTLVGGRSIHPITAVVGGFTHEISADEYLRLAEAMDA
ncbi:oligosaccharide flippase family protein, partial [bacterium]|nr:oligosaccharide flippase family protein [bacterium]